MPSRAPKWRSSNAPSSSSAQWPRSRGRANETLIEVADREGVEIPRLCYKPGLDAAGNCRACMVEIKGERVLAPSCCRAPTGMEVDSDSPRAVAAQKMVLELLQSDMPERTTPATTKWTSGR
jgi:predicted molibdopterin-dependent oxidoreductase YjgC